jgi:hypothetical protein
MAGRRNPLARMVEPEVHMARKQWSDLSKGKRVGVVVSAVLQIALLVAALADIKRRPAALIRGGKVLWTGLSFVNYVGPLAYFAFGRKRQEA